MTTSPSPPVAPQPLLAVADVPASARWYGELLALASGHGPAGHGGHEYERLLSDGVLVLQLHAREEAHHHGRLYERGVPAGNGVVAWFAVEAFDEAVARSRALGATVEHDVHVNPNARQRELWLRDPDGYLVVLAEGPTVL